MAVTTHTISGNIGDLVDFDFDPDLVNARIESNIPSGEILVAGTTMRLGDREVIVDSTGAFTQAGFVASDSADTNVDPDTPLQYRLVATVPRSSDGKRITVTSTWFELDADVNVATAQGTLYLPVSFVSEVTAQMLEYVEQAGAAADGFDIGTVTTGAVGDPAAASITGTAPNKELNLTLPRGATGSQGIQGLPGPGSAAWAAAVAVTIGALRQAPDGAFITSTAARTTGASYDATEAGFWDELFVRRATTTNPVPQGTLLRSMTIARGMLLTERIARGNVTEGATTLENSTYSLGINQDSAYSKSNTSEALLRFGMESSWLNSGTVHTEVHFTYIDPASTTGLRPIAFDVVQGGDGGLGSPRVSFQISDTDAGGGWAVRNVSGTLLMNFGNSAWYFGRNVNVQRGAGGASLLTVGDHLHDARVLLDAKSAGGVNQIEIQRGGVSNWLIYDAGNNTDLYFRDTINSRSHIDLIRGATSAAAYTDFYSNIRALGTELQVGPAANKAVIGALSGVEAWFDAQGSSTNIGVSIRAKGTGVIKALSAFQAQGNVGFYNGTPAAKQTVSGSRGGNAALASAISALATIGLVTDATTA